MPVAFTALARICLPRAGTRRRRTEGKRLKYLAWLLKAAIFFALFAFALNNQQDATVHFFFGTQWRAPMVLVVLAAFAVGVAVGALGMVPRWWSQRSAARRAQGARAGGTASPNPAGAAPSAAPVNASSPGVPATGPSVASGLPPHGI